MNNKKTRNRLFTLLLLVMALLIPQWGWAQTAIQPEKGDGGADNPYIIRTAENLAWFRDEVNTGQATICAKIADDVEVIDLKDFCHKKDAAKEELSWEPIGNENNKYQGTFDGNGKTIKNLYINVSQDYMGLFGFTAKSTLKNLTLEHANVTNMGNYTGILVGDASNRSILQNIKISDSCEMNGASIFGGIAGELYGKAYNCVNYATVQGNSYVGGLFGGFMGNAITACANYGDVTATSHDAGGLVGISDTGTIQDCANYGDVKGDDYVAGIAAGVEGQGKIKNVFCYGNISATKKTSWVGMIFGYYSEATEGMVAYYSGAKLTVDGKEQQVKAFGGGNLSEDNATGFTAAQLKSGEVAWLLNGSTSVPAAGKTLAWYQKLGEKGDKYPVLTQKDGNTVYCNECICVDTQVKAYSNTEASEHEKFDKHVKGTETLLADGLYSYTCQRCQTNYFKYIKDFCGIPGNDLELTDDNGKYIAKAVTLTDGEAYNSPVDIEVKDLKYARTYAANKWQPLYVPFAMNVEQWTGKGLTVASINNFHEMKLESGDTQVLLEVKKVTSGSLDPNVPYLILCDAEGENLLELGTTTLSKAEEGSIDCHSVTRNYVFQGKYSTMSGFGASETAIYYGVKDGEMVQLEAADEIGPQNWYLTVTNRSNAYDVDTPLTSAAKAISISVIGDGEATGIEDIHVISDEGENGKQGIFDLQGRQLNAEPTHGIYIKNGKKYVK